MKTKTFEVPVETNSSHGLAVLLIVGLAHVANAQVAAFIALRSPRSTKKRRKLALSKFGASWPTRARSSWIPGKRSEYVASHIPGARNIDAQPANRLRLLNTLFQRIRNPKRSFALMRNPDVLRLENNELFYRHVTCVLGG